MADLIAPFTYRPRISNAGELREYIEDLQWFADLLAATGYEARDVSLAALDRHALGSITFELADAVLRAVGDVWPGSGDRDHDTVNRAFDCLIFDAHLPSMTARFRIPEGFPFAGGIYRIQRVRAATPEDESRWAHFAEPPMESED